MQENAFSPLLLQSFPNIDFIYESPAQDLNLKLDHVVKIRYYISD